MSDTPTTPEAMLARLKQSVQKSGFTTLLAAQPIRCWQGESEILLELRPELTQHHGFAHGGVIGALADNACAWAAASVAGDVVTSSYTLHFLGPAVGDRLRAKGRVIRTGQRQVTVQADVFVETADETKLVATALATIARV
ncbi:PaaI family thioesterase [Vitreimonas sp.]|jgi:uncharacterized protein (TIGR00369 family)|uniref:PaaI family thioesterase n=1 Tax=Vitreimonas sp. TaxID=3069702 RepID=UPI002ED9D6AE